MLLILEFLNTETYRFTAASAWSLKVRQGTTLRTAVFSSGLVGVAVLGIARDSVVTRIRVVAGSRAA
jgi:hypothetical protein